MYIYLIKNIVVKIVQNNLLLLLLLVVTLILIQGKKKIPKNFSFNFLSNFRPAFCVSHPWLEALALSVETNVCLASTSNGDNSS
jgi:hypothetical protein